MSRQLECVLQRRLALTRPFFERLQLGQVAPRVTAQLSHRLGTLVASLQNSELADRVLVKVLFYIMLQQLKYKNSQV